MPTNNSDHYVIVGGRAFEKVSYFEVGDTVTRISKASRSYSQIQRGDTGRVRAVDVGSAVGGTVRIDNQSIWIYNQKVLLDESISWYNSSNFMLAKKGNSNMSLQLEQDRPTFVREFKEVVKDGKTVREYIGDWVEFQNMSAAKTFTSNEITSAIRMKNEYRKFAIFSEKHVSQAKQPEIEFV